MKEYMKMGDVFAGLVSNHDGELLDDNGFVADCYNPTSEKGDLMAHAINSHDELVQMNQELLAALELARNDAFYVSSGFAHAAWRCQQARDAIRVIDAAVAKAKGGAA